MRDDEKEHWKTLCNLVQYDDMQVCRAPSLQTIHIRPACSFWLKVKHADMYGLQGVESFSLALASVSVSGSVLGLGFLKVKHEDMCGFCRALRTSKCKERDLSLRLSFPPAESAQHCLDHYIARDYTYYKAGS